VNQNGGCCLLSVDGTDFSINEPSPFSSIWFSHKFRGPGLRYEIALAIQTGDIAWVHGPFPCGQLTDLGIFRLGLKNRLLPGERVEADAIYTEVQCDGPFDYCFSVEQYKAKFKVRARHETVNRRFTQFGILAEKFRHPKEKDVHVFMATAVLTHITMKTGILFSQLTTEHIMVVDLMHSIYVLQPFISYR
jgi:hypothetical protein